MLSERQALRYEILTVLLGSLLILVIQILTIPLFTWILWVYSFISVTLGFIDHVCVGWEFSFGVQMRRMLYNLLNCAITGAILYFSVIMLLPDTTIRNVSDILLAAQRLIRLHNYFGPILYTYLYFLMHETVLSFFRIFINLGYTIFMACNDISNASRA